MVKLKVPTLLRSCPPSRSMPRSQLFLSDLEGNILNGSPRRDYSSNICPQIIHDRCTSDASHRQGAGSAAYVLAVAHEATADRQFPPCPTRYPLPAILLYRFTSTILSPIFLSSILICALLKPIPAFCSKLWSCCWSFRNHKGCKIKHQQDQNDLQGTDTLKCDISYYANLVGLDCEETKIETEDGFILTLQHIIDRRPDSVHWKRTNPNNLRCIDFRKIPCSTCSRSDAVIRCILCQR
jgi:hypothetical protein